MARLYLFAEGSTELTFADTVLKPHLANVGVRKDVVREIRSCRMR